MRLARILLCATLVSGLVVAGGGTAAAECETVSVEVYDVRLDIGRKTYHVGETVRVDATVTRKQTETPVHGAMFGVLVMNSRKERAIFGFGETNAAGHATARLELRKKDVRVGPVDLFALAYKRAVDLAGCAQVTEYGQKRVRKAFVVEP
ncbi:MAG: hypothetical protein M3279_00735 [Actinomycetota bacterium]|nr:hypothetical protein [Actinomycetota bacterium]